MAQWVITRPGVLEALDWIPSAQTAHIFSLVLSLSSWTSQRYTLVVAPGSDLVCHAAFHISSPRNWPWVYSHEINK